MDRPTKELMISIANYRPFNVQESADKEAFLSFLKSRENFWTRENLTGHLTASAWIVNPSFTKVLMVYHHIYDSWAWTGGHADGETDLLCVALNEAREETGLESVSPHSDSIYSLEVLTVDGHMKNGSRVASHLHYNLTYLLVADDTRPVRSKPDENAEVAWFRIEDAAKASSEPYMRQIYRKLNRKIAEIILQRNGGRSIQQKNPSAK